MTESIFASSTLIFASETTKAMNREWHQGHFACFHCDKELAGCRYVVKDGNAYCPSCYETLFCHKCDVCHELIGVGGRDLEHNDRHWHAACFQCSDCNKSLVDMEFAIRDEKLYCAECHDNNFAPRCDHCKQVFRTGMKKFEYEGRKWHAECFQCDECHQPICDQKFAPADDQRVVCVHCYEQAYAPRCHNCKLPISKSGVTYNESSWHRECFRCTQCARILADDKFTPHDDKPYCVPCFGQLFAKKCERCTKPITGPGTIKFASFDNRHWHNECFICSKCRVSLVGQGFLLEGPDIICTGCVPV